jgi:tRNA-dihydrouridine synthase
VLGVLEMRRHYANYLKGLPNIKDYRIKLTTFKQPEEIFSLLDEINKTYTDFQPEKRKLNISELAYSCG